MKKIDIKKIVTIYTPLLLLIFFESCYLAINKNFLLSLFIVYSLYVILIAVFKNTKWATLSIAVVGYIIFLVSMFKLSFTSEPFYFSDVLYLNSTDEIFGIVNGSFKEVFIRLLSLNIFVLFMYIIIVFMSFRYNYHLDSKKMRITLLAIGIFILLIMFLPIKPINKFIINNFYNVNDRKDFKAITTGDNYCEHFGHLAGMYGIMLESRVFKPKGYDVKKIDKALKNSPTESDKSLGKPNIIVVFSESFWDIDQLDEVEFNKPVTENFNKLKEEGLFFDMLSPSYGGISANVEFEFLTGGSLNYFGRSYVPYMSLYNNKKYYNTPSIINELNNANYYTKIVAYTKPTLFKCGKVYNYFKVDDKEFNYNVSEEHKKGSYVSDEYVTDKIIKELEIKDKDTPLFYMTLTMQSHMVYNKDKYDNYDIEIVKSNLKDKYNDELLSYAQGVYDADKQLGRLYEYIKEYDEPTIIIFYGDHLPYLESYDKLNYFHTDDDKTDIFRKYNTQSLVLANFDISSLKEENKTIKYLSPDLLSAYILNHMDIDLSDYYRWLYSTKETIGASNKYVSVNQDGEIFYTNKLEGKMKEVNDFRETVQYRLFIK